MGPRHPVEAKFSNDGNALYVVDIGVIGFELAGAGPFPIPSPASGVIWRISKQETDTTEMLSNLSYLPKSSD